MTFLIFACRFLLVAVFITTAVITTVRQEEYCKHGDTVVSESANATAANNATSNYEIILNKIISVLNSSTVVNNNVTSSLTNQMLGAAVFYSNELQKATSANCDPRGDGFVTAIFILSIATFILLGLSGLQSIYKSWDLLIADRIRLRLAISDFRCGFIKVRDLAAVVTSVANDAKDHRAGMSFAFIGTELSETSTKSYAYRHERQLWEDTPDTDKMKLGLPAFFTRPSRLFGEAIYIHKDDIYFDDETKCRFNAETYVKCRLQHRLDEVFNCKYNLTLAKFITVLATLGASASSMVLREFSEGYIPVALAFSAAAGSMIAFYLLDERISIADQTSYRLREGIDAFAQSKKLQAALKDKEAYAKQPWVVWGRFTEGSDELTRFMNFVAAPDEEQQQQQQQQQHRTMHHYFWEASPLTSKSSFDDVWKALAEAAKPGTHGAQWDPNAVSVVFVVVSTALLRSLEGQWDATKCKVGDNQISLVFLCKDEFTSSPNNVFQVVKSRFTTFKALVKDTEAHCAAYEDYWTVRFVYCVCVCVCVCVFVCLCVCCLLIEWSE